MVRPAGKRAVVSHLVQARGLSQRRACRLADLNLSTWQYAPRREQRPGLRERLKELAAERRRFGYWRLHALLWREGWRVNHKTVHRIYVEEVSYSPIVGQFRLSFKLQSGLPIGFLFTLFMPPRLSGGGPGGGPGVSPG